MKVVSINCPRCGRFMKGWADNPAIPRQKVDCEKCNSTFVVRPLPATKVGQPWMDED
jgi:transposase-like protein